MQLSTIFNIYTEINLIVIIKDFNKVQHVQNIFYSRLKKTTANCNNYNRNFARPTLQLNWFIVPSLYIMYLLDCEIHQRLKKSPNTHFYITLYSRCVLSIFCNKSFDNANTTHHLSYFKARHERYPLMPDVLKFEYVKPKKLKQETTVQCARNLGQS